MTEWVNISLKDLSDIEPIRKNQGHVFISPKCINWLRYCKYCGHVGLKNKISVLVSRIGCNYHADSRYIAWRKNPRIFS